MNALEKMKKIFIISLTSFFVFASLVSPVQAHETEEPHEESTPSADMAHATAAPDSASLEQINSFELFWPISAGKVRGETLYFLKGLKEKVRELLVFSNFKKADYNITLSVKRTVEAEKLLLDKKDLENAKLTLNEAQAKRDKAFELIQKAKDEGKEIKDLVYTLKSSLEKQKLLLESLAIKVEGDAKTLIQDNLSNLGSLHAKL